MHRLSRMTKGSSCPLFTDPKSLQIYSTKVRNITSPQLQVEGMNKTCCLREQWQLSKCICSNAAVPVKLQALTREQKVIVVCIFKLLK